MVTTAFRFFSDRFNLKLILLHTLLIFLLVFPLIPRILHIDHTNIPINPLHPISIGIHHARHPVFSHDVVSSSYFVLFLPLALSIFINQTLFWWKAPHDIFLKKYLLALKVAYIVYISKKRNILTILFLEKGVLFLPASWAFPILKPVWRRKWTPFPIIVPAYYNQKLSLCGNFNVWLL